MRLKRIQMKHTSQILKMIEELLYFSHLHLEPFYSSTGTFFDHSDHFFTLKWYDEVCYCESEFFMVSAL